MPSKDPSYVSWHIMHRGSFIGYYHIFGSLGGSELERKESHISAENKIVLAARRSIWTPCCKNLLIFKAFSIRKTIKVRNRLYQGLRTFVVDHRGIEPLTSRLRTWRSPSWANGPNRLLAYYSTFFRFVKKIFVDYILFLSYNAFAAFDKAALVGEPAVPCNLQSATAGMNSQLRICHVSSDPGKQRWRIGLTQREPVNHVRRGTEQH